MEESNKAYIQYRIANQDTGGYDDWSLIEKLGRLQVFKRELYNRKR
jgi:hypothetical protein